MLTELVERAVIERRPVTIDDIQQTSKGKIEELVLFPVPIGHQTVVLEAIRPRGQTPGIFDIFVVYPIFSRNSHIGGTSEATIEGVTREPVGIFFGNPNHALRKAKRMLEKKTK